MNELTDEQRQLIQAFFEQNPDGGYKSACKAAGIHATKAEAKQLIDGDDSLAEARERALGVNEDSAWKRVAAIAANLEHKDALRANTFILGAIHGRSETARMEVTGSGGGPVVVAHERRLTLADVAQLAQRLDGLGDSPAGQLPAARPVLPAPVEDQPAASAVPARPEP